MKKLLGILVLGLLWCTTAYTECMGNCVNGSGTMKWPNGDMYVGEWKNGKKHGVGTLTWTNGIKYTGDWKNDIEDGKGTVTWPNGSKYIGERYNAQAHGKGTMKWPNGDMYVGEWKNDKEHGLGKMTWSNGFFEGNWKNGFEDRSKPFLTSDKEVAKVVWDNSIPISRKKYMFDDATSLKRLIKKKAPTTLKELKFLKKTKNKSLLGYQGLPEFCKGCKKAQQISYDAYIFHAHFESGNIIRVLVNTKYKNFERAEKLALRYATLMGQLPTFLNEKNAINSITIHPGKRRWIASGKKITIYPSSDWYDHEKSLIHEAAHAAVDDRLVNDPDWKAAVDADGKYITKYARTNEFEDAAETVIFWVAVRCMEDRISKSNYKRILKAIPNRLKYLDEQNYDVYPLICK